MISLSYSVLYDRFISDIPIDLMCKTKDYKLLGRLVDSSLFLRIPENSKLIIIDVPESIVYYREHDILSIEYFKERKLSLSFTAEMGVKASL